MSSPACAPERNSAMPLGTSPNTVMQMLSGPCVVSPPINSQPWASAKANKPREKPAKKTSSARGNAKANVKATGCAPQAAKSLKFTANALCPKRSGNTVLKKWRPSTNMSLDTASCMPGPGAYNAQSSPTPKAARVTGRVKYFCMRSNSPMDIPRLSSRGRGSRVPLTGLRAWLRAER